MRRWGARTRRRLRAVTPAGWCAVAITLATLVPAWWASLAALRHGWWPDRDDAQIAMRTLDVLHGHLQFVGARSTAGLVSAELSSHHPGPLEFYLLALPVGLAGGLPVGLVVGTALLHSIALVAVGRAAWLLGRLRLVGFVAAASLVVAYATGNGNLFRPLNTGPPTFYLLLLPLCATLVFQGRVWWMVGYAAAATLVCQAQLAYCPYVAVLSGVVVVVGLVQWRRRRGAFWPFPGRGHGLPVNGRPGWMTVLVLAVLWVLPVLESLSHHPGNATQLWRYLRADKAEQAAVHDSVARFLAHYLGWPVPGPFPDPVKAVLSVLLMIAVVLLARTRRRHSGGGSPDQAARSTELWLTVFAVGGVPVEVACLFLLLPPNPDFAPSAYWLTPLTVASAFLWAIGAWLGSLVLATQVAPLLSARATRLVAVAGAVAAAVLVAVTNTSYDFAENRVLTQTGALARAGVASRLAPGVNVRVTSGGTSAFVNPVSGMSYRLMQDGVFTCSDLPWPLPESTDFRSWSACLKNSPVVVALLDDSRGDRPRLPGSWHRVGATSTYLAPNGQPRFFEVYLVTPRSR